jgi:membrane protein YdbS with pleckstrin-like domain
MDDPPLSSPEPDAEDGEWQTLDPRQVSYERITWALRVLFEAAVLAALVVSAEADRWLTPTFRRILAGTLGAGVVLDAVLAVLLPPLRWRRARWRVDARGVEIRSGVWWRNRVAVPRSRIQHLDVAQGPIQRRYGLGTLVLHTAGSADASVPLAGLSHERALALRDDLAAWAATPGSPDGV